MSSEEEVPLERDHYWWLHPAIRGAQSLNENGATTLPWRWSSSSTVEDEQKYPTLELKGPYADFAKLLYKLNGYKPGPVKGWFVVVSPEPEKFAVGQLCVDPNIPVVLYEDLVFPTEEQAREKANALKKQSPGLRHTS